MPLLDIEEITDEKISKIEGLLEQLILDSFLTALRKISDNREQAWNLICHKTDCPMRDDIPF